MCCIGKQGNTMAGTATVSSGRGFTSTEEKPWAWNFLEPEINSQSLIH